MDTHEGGGGLGGGEGGEWWRHWHAYSSCIGVSGGEGGGGGGASPASVRERSHADRKQPRVPAVLATLIVSRSFCCTLAQWLAASVGVPLRSHTKLQSTRLRPRQSAQSAPYGQAA